KNTKQLPNTGEATQLVYLVAGFILLACTAIFTKVKALKK
ncbi:TPA: LPXTG cell wall anchor domain-containing protein, partial [Streptococcus suis]